MLAAALVTACAPPPIRTPGAFGPVVEVCEQGRPCELRPTAGGTFNPAAPLPGDGPPDTPQVERLRAVADSGDPVAQYRLGLAIYRRQAAGTLYDALQMLRRSADGGHVPAQKAVGRLYMTGLDTMGQDLNEAQRWLSLAAPRDAEARRWLVQVERGLANERAYGYELQRLNGETQAYWSSWASAAWSAPWPSYWGRY